MKLDEYLDIDEIGQLVTNGYVSCKRHNEFPLYIYNYTKSASYCIKPDDWSDTLHKCRGLIVHHDGEIVAFGQKKFWNYDPEKHSESGPYVVADKLDGSLGIVYEWEGVPYVATRGSFHSEMADWANEFLDTNPKYRDYLKLWTEDGYTPHVEIIYNDNRIVIDYDYEDLVLLGWTHPRTGNWLNLAADSEGHPFGYPGRVAKVFPSDTHLYEDRPNAEGYVIQFLDSGNRYKIKHDWYIELQRAAISLTPKRIWRHLVDGTIDKFMMDLPNEFYDDAEAMERELLKKFRAAHSRYLKCFIDNLDLTLTRKEQAQKIAHLPGDEKSAFFMLLDANGNSGGRLRNYVWEQIKPKAE